VTDVNSCGCVASAAGSEIVGICCATNGAALTITATVQSSKNLCITHLLEGESRKQ
jgi:hypothetical protein